MSINKLTEAGIKNAKPSGTGKRRKLFDGDGLFLLIDPKGGKWWRFKYRYQGVEKTLSLGVYPTISLKDARELREKAKKQVALGQEPVSPKKAAIIQEANEVKNSFEYVAREWHSNFLESWTKSTAARILTRLEQDIFPYIGKMEISAIKAPILLEHLRRVEKRGAIETTHRILQECGRIFRYAIATGRAENDPASALKNTIKPTVSTHFASLKDPKDIRNLLINIDNYKGSFIVRCALKIAPLVFVRPGELRKAQWDEFDFDAKEWRIPAARMKMRELHVVPLSEQVIEILNELRPYTMSSIYLFPSPRSNVRPLSDATLLNALRNMGYSKEEITVRGFRSMASTLLNEQGYNRDWIERQLAHSEHNSIRAAYNYAEYLPERRKMMQDWADYLDELKDNKVINFVQKGFYFH
jgi:integrase